MRAAAFQDATVHEDTSQELAAITECRFPKNAGIVLITANISDLYPRPLPVCLGDKPALTETVAASNDDVPLRGFEEASCMEKIAIRHHQSGRAGRLERDPGIENVALSKLNACRHERRKRIQYMVAFQRFHHGFDGQIAAGYPSGINFFKERVHAEEMDRDMGF